jgi:hypothetical protein
VESTRRRRSVVRGTSRLTRPISTITSCWECAFPAPLVDFRSAAPCRGSLLSGRYPHQCIPGHEYLMPAGQKSLRTHLRGMAIGQLTSAGGTIRVPFIIAGEKQRYNGRSVSVFPVAINHGDIAPSTLALVWAAQSGLDGEDGLFVLPARAQPAQPGGPVRQRISDTADLFPAPRINANILSSRSAPRSQRYHGPLAERRGVLVP